MRYLFFILLSIWVTCAFAQKKDVLLTDVLKEVILTGEDAYVENANVRMDDISAGVWPNMADSVYVKGVPIATNSNFLELDKYFKVALPELIKITDGRVHIPGEVFFSECTFPQGLVMSGLHFEKVIGISRSVFEDNVYLDNIRIRNINSHWTKYGTFIIENSDVDDLLHFHWDDFSEEFSIHDSRMGHRLELLDVSLHGRTEMYNNTIDSADFELVTLTDDSIYFGRDWQIYDRLIMKVEESSGAFLWANNVSYSDNHGDLYRFDGMFDEVNIFNNTISGMADFDMQAGSFSYRNNSFKKVDISTFSFSETLNDISWQDFDENRLAILNSVDGENDEVTDFKDYSMSDFGVMDTSLISRYFEMQSTDLVQVYFGEKTQEMADEELFRQLFRSYYKLYSVLRANGDIESANASYIDMKDLESRRLHYLYRETGNVDLLFKYGLNELLRVYTDQGTNPAKAVRISFYLILLFALFYFFFPSEWDKEPKKEMIRHYRQFIEKNDHGYLKPFMKMVWGILLSLLNAIMLSMNAFITLGFGRIPTRGLARYVCIVQGTIGWFLLSIFTVSLINQLLI